jgi:hypothetical protein
MSAVTSDPGDLGRNTRINLIGGTFVPEKSPLRMITIKSAKLSG